MKRREFITLLGGAAAAWPLAARGAAGGQAADHRVPGRGTPSSHGANGSPPLCSGCANSAGSRVAPSRSSIAGRRGAASAIAEIAAEFVRLKVDVIVTGGTAAAVAAKQATSVIPIVFCGGGGPDRQPVWSQAWRDRAATSPACRIQQTDLAGKRLELLREVVPGLRRLAIMANGGNPASCGGDGRDQAAARMLGLEVVTIGNPASARISRLLSRRSRAARRHFMSVATRS